MNCSILSSSHFLTRELRGKCNQSCQQYRSDNSISPKPATKRFLIFRIELLIFIDELPAHRTPPSLPGGDGGGVSATSKTLCEAVHIIERGMAGPLLACRGGEGREPLKRVACGKIKVPTEREFFVRRYSLMRHPTGRGGDAKVIATLPNPPAEIIDAYSRKLSSESMKTAQAPVSPLVFVCVPTVRRHMCKTLKGLLSFGAMRNVRAVIL